MKSGKAQLAGIADKDHAPRNSHLILGFLPHGKVTHALAFFFVLIDVLVLPQHHIIVAQVRDGGGAIHNNWVGINAVFQQAGAFFTTNAQLLWDIIVAVVGVLRISHRFTD